MTERYHDQDDKFLGNHNVVVRVDRPRIVVMDDFLGPTWCQRLIDLATPRMKLSTTINDITGIPTQHPGRTSRNCFFQRGENELVNLLDVLISDLTGIPVERGEGLQVVQYGVGGEYQPHYDYFPSELPGSKMHLAGGQRHCSVIVFLKDVVRGGETAFPKISLRIAPKRGRVVAFWNLDNDGQPDPLTQHGGLPVITGEKWIAVKWLREREYK